MNEHLKIVVDARRAVEILEPICDAVLAENEPHSHLMAAAVSYLDQWIHAKTTGKEI